MKLCAIIVLNIVSLMVFADAQMMKDQSSDDDWSSMSGLDSTPMLTSEQIKSLDLDEINMNSDADDSFVATTGSGRREREVRAFFDLILNILETIRGPAKNDIRRKDNN